MKPSKAAEAIKEVASFGKLQPNRVSRLKTLYFHLTRLKQSQVPSSTHYTPPILHCLLTGVEGCVGLRDIVMAKRAVNMDTGCTTGMWPNFAPPAASSYGLRLEDQYIGPNGGTTRT